MPLFLTLRPNFSVWQPVMSFNPLTPGAFCKKCVFWTFWWFSGWISAKLGWKCIRNSMPFLPLASRLQHFGSRVRRNQNIEIFEFFSAISFIPFVFFLLQWLTFYWACLWLKKISKKASSRQAILIMEQPGVVEINFALSFSINFLSSFVHISGSIWPLTLIWASLERYFPPAEVEYRRRQFWSKVMTSEEEERLRLVTAGYGRHSSQWVKPAL